MVRRLAVAATIAAGMLASAAIAQTPGDDAPPVLPTGASAGFVPPPQDAGGYVTPNRDLSVEETMWHVRTALNVAALGCRGVESAELVDGYNALLDYDRGVLATAADGVVARYKARFGVAWQERHDDAMTRLYNYWATPPAQRAFCAAAREVMRDAAATPADRFSAFATAALARLEAPILAFFAAYDRYRVAQRDWSARHMPIAAATTPAGTVVAEAATPVVDGAALAQVAAPIAPAMAAAIEVPPPGSSAAATMFAVATPAVGSVTVEDAIMPASAMHATGPTLIAAVSASRIGPGAP